jgi:hypothetical protein
MQDTLSDSLSRGVLRRVKKLALLKCKDLPDDFKKHAVDVIDAMHTEEVTIVPYVMDLALGLQNKIDTGLLDELALANLFGWLAYTIYDDCLDTGINKHLLPMANFFARALALQYIALDALIPGIRHYYEKLMNIIDIAHFREKITSSTGEVLLEELSDRSIGHALPALGVILAGGYPVDSAAASTALLFFRYYLAARQLHDDAHDWREDLEQQRITSVVARLLALSKKEETCPLEIIFWHDVIPTIAQDIKDLLYQARQVISDSKSFPNPSAFEEIIGRLESAVELTLRERKRAMEFIAAYAF